MPTLRIDLQEGFDGDDVILRVDGEECLHRQDVRTKRTLGVAGNVKVEVEAGARTLQIELPGRGVTRDIPLDVQGRLYVGLSLRDGEVDALIRDKPFGYG